MQLAFLILAHKNPLQLQMLADYLHRHNCAVFIHIDRKSKKLFGDFIKDNATRKNFYIFSRYRVHWGGYSQIKATVFLLREAAGKRNFDFVSLISGQDAPIRPIPEFKDFLAGHPHASFIEWHQVPANENWAGNGGLDRLRYFWITAFPQSLGFFFNRVQKLVHIFQNTFQVFKRIDLPLYGGGNWFTLNREMTEYVCDFLSREKDFLPKFRNSRCADEIFIQTILLNSEHKQNIINNSLRYIDWKSGPEYPRTFRSEDTDHLMEQQQFFARKFDKKVDGLVLEKIYNNL